MKKILILIMAFGLLFTGCRKPEQPEPELLEPVGVSLDTEIVSRGNITKQITYEANVAPSSIPLSFSTDGTIEKVNAYIGEYVEAGDPILTLNQESLKKQIESLEEEITGIEKSGAYEDRIADLDIAILQTALDEYQSRPDRDAVTEGSKIVAVQQAQLRKEQAIQNRNARLEELNRSLTELRDNLKESVISAPISGTVYFNESLTEGSYVRADKTVCYVLDPTDLVLITQTGISEVEVQTKETYAWIAGERWEIELIPMSNEKMSAILSSGQPLKRSFRIKEKAGKTLKAGDYGVVIVDQFHLEDVLMVPKSTLKRDTGGYYVYIVTSESEREKRYVTIGLSNGVSTEIKDGLKEGEVIYVQD